MNEVLRVEMEAVRHDGDDVQVMRGDGPIDAFAIYLVCEARGPQENGLLVSDEPTAKLFLSRYITEHTSQEDAYAAARSLAYSLGVIFQNNVPKARQFAQPYPAYVYQKPQEAVPEGRVFFYEEPVLEFDMSKYRVSEHLLNRSRRCTMPRPGFVRELGMNTLKEGEVINGNDKICVMDGQMMQLFYYSPLLDVIRNNDRHALIDCRSREPVQDAPFAALDDDTTKKELEAFARSVNA